MANALRGPAWCGLDRVACLVACDSVLPKIILETIGQSPPRRLDARERVPRAWRLRAAKHQHGVNAQLPQQHCSSNKSARSLSNRDIGLTVHEVVPAVPPRCRPTSPFLVL